MNGSAAINFTGALTEANLRTAGRLKGETQGQIILHPLRTSFLTSAGSATLGWDWQQDGELNKNHPSSGGIESGYYWRDLLLVTGTEANFVNTNYEILRDSATLSGTWDATTNFTTQDSYLPMTLQRSLSITSTGFKDTEQVIMIRRTVASGGSGNPLAMGFYRAAKEDLS